MTALNLNYEYRIKIEWVGGRKPFFAKAQERHKESTKWEDCFDYYSNNPYEAHGKTAADAFSQVSEWIDQQVRHARIEAMNANLPTTMTINYEIV